MLLKSVKRLMLLDSGLWRLRTWVVGGVGDFDSFCLGGGGVGLVFVLRSARVALGFEAIRRAAGRGSRF